MELKEQIKTAIQEAWNDKGKDQTFGAFLTNSAESIDQIYKSYYAQQAPEGLELTEEDALYLMKSWTSVDHTISGEMENFIRYCGKAAVNKVAPIYAAREAEVVRKEQKALLTDFIPQFKAIIDTVEDAQREERINQPAPY
jgi:hypothetical protein